jgi:tRNA (adenine57-N1/adenine58-N1)-methyltransferase catalytic subunit
VTSSSERPLPAVVWDMGGIMYRYFTELLLDLASQHGWPPIALGPTGPLPDPAYEQQQRGDIDEGGYLAVIRDRLRAAGIDLDPVADLDFTTEFRPATRALIVDLHEAGHPQALVTNDASKWLGEAWWETWEPVGWFDVIIDVAVLGVRKPAPEPYLAAAERLGLSTVDCIFVDDMEVNCRGAEAVGMGSHWFDVADPVGSIAALRQRIGEAGELRR